MSKPNGITVEEFNQRRREKYLEQIRAYAAKNVKEGFCRACGGLKEDHSQQHCDKCRERRRSNNLKRIYGITAEEYEELAAHQNHVCWICKEKVTTKRGKLLVDHNHETGKIRGLLCFRCNAGLGGFCDSLELLERAVEYMKEFNDKGDT